MKKRTKSLDKDLKGKKMPDVRPLSDRVDKKKFVVCSHSAPVIDRRKKTAFCPYCNQILIYASIQS